MTWFARARARLWTPALFGVGIAVCCLVTACGGQEKAPPRSTEAVTTDDLASMVLAADDLPENLAGFTLTESKVIPNEVQANTGGDDEPVTLDDPNYGQNLAQLNSWGRQSGYRVTFTQEEQGGLSIGIRVQLDLAETETGAHAYFADWFVGDNPTSPLGIGDESHRSFTSLESSSGDIEGMGIAFAQFRTGRIIGSVSVGTNGDKGSEAKDTARELARLLFDKIQERL